MRRRPPQGASAGKRDPPTKSTTPRLGPAPSRGSQHREATMARHALAGLAHACILAGLLLIQAGATLL